MSFITPVDKLLNEVDIEPSEVLIVLFRVSFKFCISVFKLAISSASLLSFSSFGFDLKFKYRIDETITTNKTNKTIKIIFIIGAVIAVYAIARNLDIIKIILIYWKDLILRK